MNMPYTDNLKDTSYSKQEYNFEDSFKKMFKYFKSKLKTPDFSQVIDFHHCKNMDILSTQARSLPPHGEVIRKELGLNPIKDWKIYSLHNHQGLTIICNAFSDSTALEWIRRCLQEFSVTPHKTNLSNITPLAFQRSWWDEVKCSLQRNEASKLVGQLRWATMGYHHNWDSKTYSESEQSPMPQNLEILCQVLLMGIGHPHGPYFKAEAAIVNYYPPGSTLSPHTDHSEPFKEAPLISFSFGQSGVFLIGGIDRIAEPTPFFLHHGDVMIMSGESRLSYHAVPRILSERESVDKNLELCRFLGKCRCLSPHSCADQVTASSPFLTDHGIERRVPPLDCSNFDDPKVSGNRISDHAFNSGNFEDIGAVLNYIKTFRINMNVRQVKPSKFSW